MGCDIHTVVEVKKAGVWRAATFVPEVFGMRNYDLFGFFADVCNSSGVPNPYPPRGWPEDVSPEAKALAERWSGNAHTFHYITLKELKDIDYSQTFKNRCTGELISLYKFLGHEYFNEVVELRWLGEDVRVLMFFDN